VELEVAMNNNASRLAWSGRSLRMPAWLWLGLAAMTVATLHMFLDFGVGLFDLSGRLSTAEGGLVILIALIHLWWAISFAAGAQGSGSGVASVAVLAAGWTGLTNGYPIVYCPPTCAEAAPITDYAHIGSVALGILTPLVAIWSLWRARARVGVVLPLGALGLVIVTLVAFSNIPIQS
jgi:hypothetical protein